MREHRGTGLRQAIAVLLAIAWVCTFLWWLVFVQFLLSFRGLMATGFLNLAIAFVLANWLTAPERKRQLWPQGRLGAFILSISVALLAAAMFPLCSGILPDLYTRHYGNDVTFATTVEKKTKARGFYIQIPESQAVYTRDLAVDKSLWDTLAVRKPVLIKGRQSALGISILDIEPLHRSRLVDSGGGHAHGPLPPRQD